MPVVVLKAGNNRNPISFAIDNNSPLYHGSIPALCWRYSAKMWADRSPLQYKINKV